MKHFFLILFLAWSLTSPAQTLSGFNPDYHYLTSGNLAADKNLYLLTVLEQDPAICSLFRNCLPLKLIQDQHIAFRHQIEDAGNRFPANFSSLCYTQADSLNISNALADLYTTHQAIFDDMIGKHLRPSGYYQRFTNDDNKTLLLKAWGVVCTGCNHIIDHYGAQNKSKLYSTLPDKRRYYDSVQALFQALTNEATDTLFCTLTSFTARRLLTINGAGNAARHEPLQEGINKPAYNKIPATSWNNFPYSLILILGSGPADSVTSLSPTGRQRCDTAVLRYQAGLAPFIVVSGGYVHPDGTKYCEAIEMKKYLMAQYNIPEDAIITEPFARHTTTNIRNTNRIIYHYAIPAYKPVMVISSQSHISSITDTTHSFDTRNLRELGYLPYTSMARRAPSEATYLPNMESLQMDPNDPLDP